MSADKDFYLTLTRGFDNLFSETFKAAPVPDFFSELYSMTSFPPTDVYLDEDKNISFELSVSGYSPEDISIESAGDYLIVSSENKDKEMPAETKYLKRGIKKGKFVAKYFVPASRFSKEDIKASYKNGILKIVIKAMEDQKPKKVIIESVDT